jgi:tRNA(His) guanylyltransferase
MRDPMGDRMKAYEDIWRQKLPRRAYTILRLDGRSFSVLTRGMKRPFDHGFADTMNSVAEALCEKISGSVFSYTQSDEISILMQDFESENTQPWFDGNIQKIVSISAGMASLLFHSILEANPNFGYRGSTANHTFDARVFSMSDPIEVANYFVWRQRDAVRNSVLMAGQAQFGHGALQNVNVKQIQEKLFAEKGINWNDYPDGFKRGRSCFKITEFKPGTDEVERRFWRTRPAEHFKAETGSWLAQHIPALPSFKG